MDWRWQPCALDTKRDFRVILHPTASIYEVRRGLDPGSDDSVDLSPYVSAGTQTAFDCNVTLKFNRELFGADQPQPNQILEIQLMDRGEWKPIWLGMIESISNFNLQRGERSLQLVAKTRDQQDIWRNTKRVTPLFPQMTELTYIAMRIARTVGLQGDEILIPNSSYTTAHSNTQLADMNAWDMIEQIFLPIGWMPFIDNLGRLRAADRGLQGRQPDVILEDERVSKVGGQRQKPPKSRVRVLWLNPTLTKHVKQGQILSSQVITLGWFVPYWKQTVYFSDDQTQRATDTYVNPNPSCNLLVPFVRHHWDQQAENKGKLSFTNFNTVAVGFLIGAWTAAHKVPDGVAALGGGTTIPIGRLVEGTFQALFCFLMMNCGTGKYEIWGTPFDWVHARNVSEAFDSSVPTWVDNSVDLESDFIVNEEHAKTVAVRELIYQAREANKWNATIVDDPRIEYGDILQFNDGSQLFVEDFSRNLERGSEATLDVKGFLIPKTVVKPGTGFVGTDSPPQVVTPPPSGGGRPKPPLHLPLPDLVGV